LKRRKFAPAAVFLAGLLLVAVTAASVSAATRSSATAARTAPGPGQTVTFKTFNNQCGAALNVKGSSSCLKKKGTSGFASQGAKPLPKLPAKAAIKTALAKQNRALKVSTRSQPPKRGTRASTSSFGLKAAVVSPVAPSLPVVTHFGGTAVNGLNAYNQATVGGYEIAPSDNAICEGNGFVVQGVQNLIGIWDSGTLSPHGPVIAAQGLESFFAPAFGGTSLDTLGNPKCYYDPDTQKWFFTIEATDSATTAQSAVLIAVSSSSTPVGSWNIYTLDTSFSGTTCNPACFPDRPKLGANKNAIFISTDSFDYGSTAFNGAQMYILDKGALALGLGSPSTQYIDLGASFGAELCPVGSPLCPGPPPQYLNDCGLAVGNVFCFYSVEPAQTPNSMYSTDRGGTEFALSALDWFSSLDDRIALWAFTNTSTINQVFPSINVQYVFYTGQSYGFPPNAAQKLGPIPFGNTFIGPPGPPEGPIGTQDDRMQPVAFTHTSRHGHVMGAVNSIVNGRAGIAYWILRPAWSAAVPSQMITPHALVGSAANPGYISNASEDVAFPAVALGPEALAATIGYTLTGPGYFPSAAISHVRADTNFWKAPNITIAKLGQGANDDYTEYGLSPTGPLWGFYSGGVADLSNRFFSIGMIQSPNCSDVEFFFDPSCGGTRGLFTNWGTALVKTSD